MPERGSLSCRSAPAAAAGRWLRAAVLLPLLLAMSPAALAAEPPRRVVSMNVCTDQLAMLVAEEGQLLSVSFLAADPHTAALAAEAGRYRINHGLAEEVFLMRPDLVLTGTYTAGPAVQMLRRLGFRVETFEPESSFADILANLRRVGALLGREARAEALARELQSGLAALDAAPDLPLTAVVYSANSYTSGAGSLSHAAIEAAGLKNLGAELGIVGLARLPLERLVLERPDLVVLGDTGYDRPALAQENFAHPAFRAVAEGRLVRIPDRYWICGGPFTLEAVRLLRAAAQRAGAAP